MSLSHCSRIAITLGRTKNMCGVLNQTRKLDTATSGKGNTQKPKTIPQATTAEKNDLTSYKNEEYFGYSIYSYYDIDRQCNPSRVEQPAAPIKP